MTKKRRRQRKRLRRQRCRDNRLRNAAERVVRILTSPDPKPKPYMGLTMPADIREMVQLELLGREVRDALSPWWSPP